MKTAILTGAYGTIGREIARGLIRNDFRVLLIGRDAAKLRQLKLDLERDFSDCWAETARADLSLKEDIQKLAGAHTYSVDVLINNAATAPVRRMVNSEGVEMQWATNVLSYYRMFMAFRDHLLESSEPRVVNVASYWAGGLDLSDPEFEKRPYNNDAAYRQSKQADRMLTYGLAAEYDGKININTCHPGDANSKLSNDLGFGGSETAAQAAKTPLLLATTELGLNYTGEYFEYGRLSNCRFKSQRSAIDQLMNLCETY